MWFWHTMWHLWWQLIGSYQIKIRRIRKKAKAVGLMRIRFSSLLHERKFACCWIRVVSSLSGPWDMWSWPLFKTLSPSLYGLRSMCLEACAHGYRKMCCIFAFHDCIANTRKDARANWSERTLELLIPILESLLPQVLGMHDINLNTNYTCFSSSIM